MPENWNFDLEFCYCADDVICYKCGYIFVIGADVLLDSREKKTFWKIKIWWHARSKSIKELTKVHKRHHLLISHNFLKISILHHLEKFLGLGALKEITVWIDR